MAKWIKAQKDEETPYSELATAEFLSLLSDEWIIRWGYFYEDNNGETREGDFLVLSPRGQLMVIEAKESLYASNPYTGSWLQQNNSNPFIQLNAQWNAVVKKVNQHQRSRPRLNVMRSIALPLTQMDTQSEEIHGIPRKFLLGQNDLNQFEQIYYERATSFNFKSNKNTREIFLDAYGESIKPKSKTFFLRESEHIIGKQTSSTYEILDRLHLNTQFVFTGGVGTGKSWLAFELARRWAENGENGSRVLFLTYNLALTEWAKELCEAGKRKNKPSRGEIIVKGWEELTRELLNHAGLTSENFSDSNLAKQYYLETLPSILEMLLESPEFPLPSYDALVVDEAQDHDTNFFPNHSLGYWEVYHKFLFNGKKARIAAFCDEAQRPPYRGKDMFSLDKMKEKFALTPVLVHLNQPVRYTAKIYHYLKKLGDLFPEISPMVKDFVNPKLLPLGPEIHEQKSCPSTYFQKCAIIISQWLNDYLCRPEDILIISARSTQDKSLLAFRSNICNIPIVPYTKRGRGTIAFISAQRAKGLDSRAVLLVDFQPPAHLKGKDVANYFMGASRANLVLGAVHVSGRCNGNITNFHEKA